MIKVSVNAFTPKTIKTGTNSWTSQGLKISSNKFTRKQLKIGEKAWNGLNLSDGGLGDNLLSPSPFGVNEDGFSHFQNINQPDVSHTKTQQDLTHVIPVQPEIGR